MRNSSLGLAVALSAVLATFGTYGKTAAAMPNCTNEGIDALRKAVQMHDPESLALADEMMNCTDHRDEALLWRAIYLSFSDRYGEVKQIDSHAGGSPYLNGWRGQVFGKAAWGSYQELQALVESKNANWRDDAEANLILARALVRDDKLSGVRAAYERYFILKPDDFDIRIEAAFSLMHDDWSYARAQFDFLSRSKLNQNQLDAVVRGNQLIEVTRGLASSSLPNATSREVPIGFERFWSSYLGFYRHTLRSGYHRQAYQADVAAISLLSDAPDSAQTAAEMSVQKKFGFGGGATGLLAKAGWFQGAEGVPRGQLMIDHSFSSGLSLAAGHQTEPWVKYFPLPRQYTSWVQNVELAGFNFRNFFEYRFTYSTITEQGSSNKHSILVWIPLARFNQGQDVLQLKMLAEVLQAERYSAYYDSPKEATIALPGLAYSHYAGSHWHFFAEFDYGTIAELRHPVPNTQPPPPVQSTSATIMQALGEMKTGLSDHWSMAAVAQYSRNADQGGATVYEEMLLGLTAFWDFEIAARMKEAKP